MNPFALVPRRSAWPTVSFDAIAQMVAMNPFGFVPRQTLRQDREEMFGDFASLAGAFMRNSVVFAVEVKRLQLFGEARFQFQQMRGGQPGDLFGTPALRILEEPEPGQTTQDLLMRALLSADFGGTAFVLRREDRLRVLRPDWVTMILGSRTMAKDPNPVDVELLGIGYQEGGPAAGREPELYGREEFAVWSPVPDPFARYRGLPWLVPVIREIQSDSAATLHKLKFFENGATPNMVVTLDPKMTIEDAREWIALFEQDHKGVLNAYKTVFLGGGASQEVVGRDLQQLDFKATQGAGETRIVIAGGLHATVVGVSEGLQGSSLNAGNIGEARRMVADAFLRSSWASFAGSLSVIVRPPSGSRLWYDERHAPFLQDDVKIAADVQAQNTQSIRTLVDGGFVPASAVDAITAGDLRRLVHTGKLSVQLQEPGATPAEPAAQPAEPAPRSRAREDFWASSGIAAGRYVSRGDVVDQTDPVAALFPSMFETLEGYRAGDPRAAVEQVEQRLLAAGVRPTTALIAEALDVSDRTVRRWRNASA